MIRACALLAFAVAAAGAGAHSAHAAVLTGIQGKVKLSPKKGRTRAITRERRLRPGDVVVTEPGARAVIRLRDELWIELGAGSRFVLKHTEKARGGAGGILEYGFLWLRSKAEPGAKTSRVGIELPGRLVLREKSTGNTAVLVQVAKNQREISVPVGSEVVQESPPERILRRLRRDRQLFVRISSLNEGLTLSNSGRAGPKRLRKGEVLSYQGTPSGSKPKHAGSKEILATARSLGFRLQ